MMRHSEEFWRDIPGFEGKYQASTYGRIRSKDRRVRVVASGTETTRLSPGKILKPGKQKKSGHLTVVLGRKYGSMPVHTAVALTFLGARPEGMDVCHIDGNPENNCIENLRYDTRTENILDVYRIGGRWRKLNLNDMSEIIRLLDSGAYTQHAIANMFSVSDATISRIKLGGSKACHLLQDTRSFVI